MLTVHELSTEAIVPDVSGTVLPVIVSPSIELRFMAAGAWAVFELLPVIVMPWGRTTPLPPTVIFSPWRVTVLFANDWLLIGAFSTTEYALRA
jgi:hypothetical protein